MLTNKDNRIPAKYFDFSNVFSLDLAAELLEHTRINDHFINLLYDKQSFYDPIYSLGLVELEMLKTYIKANLARGFIRPSKSLSGVPILFAQKKNGSFYICVDY